MKKYLVLSLFMLLSVSAFAQETNRVFHLYPEGTRLIGNVSYADDTLTKHKLDIYLPKGTRDKIPFVIFIHGGGWLVNDKYADMSYMGNTLSKIINEGYGVASIDYRWASQAAFPALIQDCNQALSFLVDHADEYFIDSDQLALMGFSAGGHLASLQGLSNNNSIDSFFYDGKSRSFHIKGVLDYYGPADLAAMPNAEDPKAPEAILLGDTPINRPDLAEIASPVTYVDANDPPFLIFHGEFDESVPNRQSKLLSSWLTVKGIENTLTVVPDAPHYGKMFDTEEYSEMVIKFLNEIF
ncbi:alpha/beta hydrolase fold domain-containing protein [Jiulongibacter sp. NS-SX5]|uniref:alpha/beta hydrolase fold domain-containing protein n=1 Tax=Jiulongibacter sp. NS-SX5 TaxID=3463854 RepID=UPI00405A0AE0